MSRRATESGEDMGQQDTDEYKKMKFLQVLIVTALGAWRVCVLFTFALTFALVHVRQARARRWFVSSLPQRRAF